MRCGLPLSIRVRDKESQLQQIVYVYRNRRCSGAYLLSFTFTGRLFGSTWIFIGGTRAGSDFPSLIRNPAYGKIEVRAIFSLLSLRGLWLLLPQPYFIVYAPGLHLDYLLYLCECRHLQDHPFRTLQHYEILLLPTGRLLLNPWIPFPIADTIHLCQ